MYIDANDLLRELFGKKTVQDNLYKNGGAGIWDLYFESAEIHACTYKAFQRTFFNSNDRNLYSISELFLLPVCHAEKGRKEMSGKKAEEILGLTGKPLSASEFQENVKYLCEFSLPDEQLKELLERQLAKRKSECNGNGIYAGKSVCRQRLYSLYPLWSESILDNTIQAMNVFNEVTDAQARLNSFFLTALQDGFKKDIRIPGSVMWAGLTRNYPSTGRKMTPQDVAELRSYLRDGFTDSYLSDHTLTGDNADFWQGLADFEADDMLNSVMFGRQLPFMTMKKEDMHLQQLQYLFSRMPEGGDYYRDHEEMIVSAFMYEQPRINRILLKRIADNGCRPIAVSKSEFLLLFLNRLPTFEDSRKTMSEVTLERIQKYLQLRILVIGLPELLWLLQAADKERPDEETLAGWTEMYFETVTESQA